MLGDAMIQIDPETRSLVVVADDDTHQELLKVIQDLDRPKPQVLIKVVFLEVTYNKGYDVGVEGSYTFNLSSPAAATTADRTTTTTSTSGTTETVTQVTDTVNTAATLGRSVGLGSAFNLANLTEGSFVRVVTDDWQATFKALATRGKVEVLSRPSIMARNNQEAVIVVGQEVPFVTNSRITDDGQTINTIQYDNVGIILRVTPFITSNNTVEMIVAPEISSLTDQTVPISNTVSSPVIAKRSAETVVVTPNGMTAVIGGLMETQRIEAIRKVPILGDIPILGFPFRRVVRNDVKKELMIFLTPHIVNDPSTVEGLTTKELHRAELVREAFNEKEFAKFFDVPYETRVEEEVTRVEQQVSEKDVREPQVRRASAVTKPTATKVRTESSTTIKTKGAATPAPRRNVTKP
jgi:general secretion pathway protein D